MHYLKYGTTTIEYALIHTSNVSEVSITVDWIDGVTVLAPPSLTNHELNQILYKKAPWILKKWFEFEEIASPPLPYEFISGEKFKYIHRGYKLKVIPLTGCKFANLAFNQGKFVAQIPRNFSDESRKNQLRHLFQQWYIRNGQVKIIERVKLYTKKMGVHPSKVVVKEQKMRWGTCTEQHTIYINWRVFMAPMPVIDYVLVHELAHIKYANHSKEYWQFVRSILPDYEERKNWLRVNGPLLTL